MGFYGSLMDIFDPKKVIHDKNNFVSLMDIFDQKKSFMTRIILSHS